MSLFTITEKPETHFVKINGTLDENADFGNMNFPISKPVEIDMGNLERINSTGIKAWVNWVKGTVERTEDLQLIFFNCPKIFIDQINMVEGFVPENSVIKSFRVPFFCEKCDNDKIFTFRIGHEYEFSNGDTKIKYPNVQCGEAKCEMEVDTIPEKYFAFLQQQAKQHT